MLSSWFRLLSSHIRIPGLSRAWALASRRRWVQVVAAVAGVALVAVLAPSAVAGRLPFTRSGLVGREEGVPGATVFSEPDVPGGVEAEPSGPGPAGALPAPSAPRLPALTPQQAAGQRVIYSYGGLTPPPSLLQLIRHGEAAGVIFFGQNIASGPQIAKVIAELDQANASPDNPVHEPLLLMTDQEGGVVRRMPGPPLLSERQVGQSDAPAAAAAMAGSSAGANLRGVGMNVNLAPVIDVYRTPGDFDDQNQRSYSTDPDLVSELGAAFISAQQNVGVAAAAKHFPGLGAAAAAQNTDNEPVTVNVPLATIRGVDEEPYGAAIAAGVRLIMVSWAVYPALDPRRPAGLSPVIVGGELRDRLGFKGVTITDALEAGALAAYGSMSNRAVLAAGAGMDLILCSEQNVTEGQHAAVGLATGYKDGQLGRSAFDAALQRVIGLRTSLAG